MSNVVAMKMPEPRKDTPELRAALCKASVKAVRDRLSEHSAVSVKTWVYIGKELMGVQDGKSFRSMFAKNLKEQKDETKYPFSRTTGLRFIDIAKTFEAVPSGDHLPVSYRTLHELSKLSASKIERYIESGAIHPLMTRAEAHKLVNPTPHTRPGEVKAREALNEVITIFAKLDREDANRVLSLLRQPQVFSLLRKAIAR